MARYFLEISYRGTHFSGFQIQENANTIQAEVEKAFEILQKERVIMTGSSRTDAGVHALQNFFHFDFNGILNPQFLYKFNAILHEDIVAKNIYPVTDQSHCRFDAISREYRYCVYRNKNPFLSETAYYYPYSLDMEALKNTASIIREYNDFTSFSKRNTQVNNFICKILESYWVEENEQLVYVVKANRFLRGMVRGLVATQLKVGRGKMNIETFKNILECAELAKAIFSAPAKGLFLKAVQY